MASAHRLILSIFLILPGPFVLGQGLGDELAQDEEWVYCTEFQNIGGALPNCLCATTFKDTVKVNCDGVVVDQEFPLLPPKQPITSFSWRNVKAHHIPQQTLAAAGIPLESLDLSKNILRRLSDKALHGLGDTLSFLDLSENLLGDQLNPIFSSQEINRLPRLRVLRLGSNGIRKIDNGLLQGTLSLQELHLNNNELTVVPSEALNGPKALRVLNLDDNLIQEVSTSDFSKQRSLLYLSLTSNRISGLASGAFQELENLKTLLISWNHLERINSDSFTGLEALEVLDLNNNFLRELPRAAFTHLTPLRKLDLSANLIYNVNPDDFVSLRMLSILSLSRNRLTTIPENAFKYLNHLETLDLSLNQLRTIPKKLFQGLTRLRTLILSDTNLLLFPMDALYSVMGLQRLHLDFNRITAIQGIPTVNLTELILSSNLIRHMPPQAIKHLVHLQHLNLQGNLLNSLDELEWPTSLLQLNVSRNNLTTIPRLHQPLLQTLDVSHNQVQSLMSHNFLLLPQLQRLDLQRNSISKLELNCFQELKHLEMLDLSGNFVSSLLYIADLPSLHHLNLSSNQVTSNQTLRGIPSLRELDLSKNLLTNLQEPLVEQGEFLTELRLDGNGLHSFRGLQGYYPSLKILSLARNRITYVFPQAFENSMAVSHLDFSHNQLTFFPTEDLPHEFLTELTLTGNMLRHIQEMSFVNFSRLRVLRLNSNVIETLPLEPFSNSSQLQIMDLSENKIEIIGETLFRGLLRLELNLRSNYLSALAPKVFDRPVRLHEVDLSNNFLHLFPTEALQPQSFFLERLSVANNSITEVPPNSNVLVNAKHLDVSFNPLSASAVMTLLNEPKTTRTLNMAQTNTTDLPAIEIPFLRRLFLEDNFITAVPSTVFKRTTLLNDLNLAGNPLKTPPEELPLALTSLDLSGTLLNTLRGSPFPGGLNQLRLNHLAELTRLEKSTLNLPQLTELELRGTPKLGYVDIKGILGNLHYLEKIDFEVKDGQVVDQIHSALSARLRFIGLRGKAIRSVSTGALAGLSAPSVQILLTNTSLTMLPPILVPVPASSKITIDISDSQIVTISPPVLSQNIRILGINPHCDCNAIHLIKYLKAIDSSATCASPPSLQRTPISQINPNTLLCSSSQGILSSTERSTSTARVTYPTPTASPDDIIWSLPQSTPTVPTVNQNQRAVTTTPRVSNTMLDTNAMDNLILGIVGGVVTLLVIFILTLVCCLRKGNGGSGGGQGNPHLMPPKQHLHHHHHPQGKCSCKPHFPHGAATVRSNHSMYHPPPNLGPLQPMNLHAVHGQPQMYHTTLPYYVQYDEGPPGGRR